MRETQVRTTFDLQNIFKKIVFASVDSLEFKENKVFKEKEKKTMFFRLSFA